MADEQQVCPNCGNFNRAGARFCSKCGHVFKPSAVAAAPAAPAPAPASPPPSPAAPAPSAGVMSCPNCGKEVSADTRFCRHCGHPLGATQPAVAPPANVAAPVSTERATPAPGVSTVGTVKSDDDMTQPLGVRSAPPAPAALAKAASSPSTGAERGAPAWLWALVGLLIGILLGAGIVLAAPGFVGLARIAAPEVTPAAPATDAMTPSSPAVPETTTPLELPTATANVVATATPEPPPAATATTAPAAETISTPVAPPDEAETSPTTAVDFAATEPPDETEAPPADAPAAAAEFATAPADDATVEAPYTSTPLAP